MASDPDRRRLYLMRHGTVDYFDAAGRPLNPKYAGLNEIGRAQCAAAARALSGVTLDRIVASPALRAQESAAIVAELQPAGVEVVDGFREIRPGRLAEIPPERRHAELVEGFEQAGQPAARFAGGEAFGDFEARVVASLEALLGASDWQRLLLVAHDGVNRLILAWACGLELAGLARFEQDLGGLSAIDLDFAEGRLRRRRIRLVNLTPCDLPKADLELTSLEQAFAPFIRLRGS